MTLGEYLVGISFNPGGNRQVNEIKRRAADLIDYLDSCRSPPELGEQQYGEKLRLIDLAITHIEDAAMWGVKAVTKGPRDA